jgi:hypothetical protein
VFPQTDDSFRLGDTTDEIIQPWTAVSLFFFGGLSELLPRPILRLAKDYIGDRPDAGGVCRGIRNHSVQNLPGLAREGEAGHIFGVSRRFPYKKKFAREHPPCKDVFVSKLPDPALCTALPILAV